MSETISLKNLKYETVKIIKKDVVENEYMDIEVDNSHYYILENNIVSHNSLGILLSRSSGIEPIFRLSYERTKINNEGVKEKFVVYHNLVKEYNEIFGEDAHLKNPNFVTSDSIDWKMRIKVQSTLQTYITSSISSCIVKDTLIETNNGLFYLDELNKDLSKINENEFVQNNVTENKVFNKDLKLVDITSFYNNGVKEIYNTILDNKLHLKSTFNEKVLKFNEEIDLFEWCQISDLEIGDRIKIKN